MTLFTPTTESMMIAYAGSGEDRIKRQFEADRWLEQHNRQQRAEALRNAADEFVSERGRLFDQDHDCAIVATRLDEMAAEIEGKRR